MRIHRVGGITDQHRSVGDPRRYPYTTCRHIGSLIPISQVLKQSCKLRRNLGPVALQHSDATLLDGIVGTAGDHVEEIHFVSGCRKEPKNLLVADVVEGFRQWLR